MQKRQFEVEFARLIEAGQGVIRTKHPTTDDYGPDEVDQSKFREWATDTRTCFASAFGNEHHLTKEADKVLADGCWRAADADKLLAIVKSAQGSVAREVLVVDEGENAFGDPMVVLARVFERFHTVVKRLRERRKDAGSGKAKTARPTLNVTDEYDVQELLHALLQVFFDDVRREEWVPSVAGSTTRVDLVLWKEHIAIETKMTRAGLDEGKLVDELIIDIRHYQAHPRCKTLVAFVYDPNEFVSNPSAVEGDLAEHTGGLPVRVFVRGR